MKEEIVRLLKELGIEYKWLDHEAVFTVAESQKVIEEKTPIKNLLLQEKGGKLWLVIMRGDQRLIMKELAKTLDTRKLSFAKPEVLQEKLGVTPGSGSLFSLLNNAHNDVVVVIDEVLKSEAKIGFHPNDNTATIFISGNDLIKILEFTGNSYIFFALDKVQLLL